MPGLPFTVMTPVFNGARFIERCYRCLVLQSVREWEWLVVDDGSTDDTPRRLGRIARSDRRVRIIRFPENRGRAHARTRALHEAGGEWLVVWDADDMYLPARLERIDRARLEGYDFYVSQTLVVDERLRFRGWREFRRPFAGLELRAGDHASMAVRMETARRFGYQPHLRTYGGIGEDVAMVYGLPATCRGYYDDQPMLVNMIGNEIVLRKAIDANRVRVDYWKSLVRSGALPIGAAEFDAILRAEERKMRKLRALRGCPWLYTLMMRVRKRGGQPPRPLSEAESEFLDRMRREFPPGAALLPGLGDYELADVAPG